MKTDTIVAQATSPGRGGIGILRVSGADAKTVAKAVLTKIPLPRLAEYLPFYGEQGEILDRGIALFFPAPHSFTGEDVLELQGHGGSVILDMLLKRVLQVNGVRIAQPGEFSQRAFLNNKMDLTQAEAMADLINASSEQAAQSAMASLQGVFSQQVNQLVDALIQLRTFVEGALDFPDEEIDALPPTQVAETLKRLLDKVSRIRQQAQQGSLLREGINVVVAGCPNVGKSSLLNALAGDEIAIVTDIAGTTRDVLKASINLDGIPLHIMDTAGLRVSDDPVERIGIERAWQQLDQADHVLFLVDSGMITPYSDTPLWRSLLDRLPQGIPITVIRNKADLSGEGINKSVVEGYPVITLSVKTGQGLDRLRQHLKQRIGWTGTVEGCFLARRRHLDALERVQAHLLQANQQLMLFQTNERLAEELRLAQVALSEITGQFSSDDLLGEIFSSFCIGK